MRICKYGWIRGFSRLKFRIPDPVDHISGSRIQYIKISDPGFVSGLSSTGYCIDLDDLEDLDDDLEAESSRGVDGKVGCPTGPPACLFGLLVIGTKHHRSIHIYSFLPTMYMQTHTQSNLSSLDNS